MTIPFSARRFRSTVPFYARYRVPYPHELIAAVAGRVGLEKGDKVLDLGCGPGPLAIGFARLGLDVLGLDPEPEMLAAARQASAQEGLGVRFEEGSSYDLGPGLGRFKLVTMGRSFHWMDRTATLAALDGLVEPGGAIALFHDRRILTRPDWRSLMEELALTYAPEAQTLRKWRQGPDWVPHEAVLLDSAFSRVESLGRIFSRILGPDDIVGRIYSMSVASPEQLGDRRTAFEDELRAGLSVLAGNDVFTEIVSAEAVLAFRP